MPVLDIDNLLNNSDAHMLITGLSEPIKAYISQDTGITTSVQWAQSDAGSHSQSLSNILNEAAAYANLTFGTDIAQRQIKTAFSSIVDYSGTDNYSMTLNMAFISIREGGSDFYSDVRKAIKILAEGQFPVFEGGRNILGAIRAPNNFSKTRVENPTGTVALRIGNWFRTQPVFVVTGSDFSFSKQVTPNGNPLYAIGSASFMSYRILELSEFQGFFI